MARELKEIILTTCKNQLSDKIVNLKDVMDEAQKAANDYGLPKDRYDSFELNCSGKGICLPSN